MMGTSGARYILLDRDGVLNRDVPASVRSPGELELLDGAADAVARLTAEGYRVMVVTNQACVGRGDLSLVDLERIHLKLLEEVAGAGGWITSIYVCPHTDGDGCDCRKPAPGLIERARADHGFDPEATWLVGDDRRDIEAAVAAGCRPALVRTGKGAGVAVPDRVAVFDDLEAFVDHVLSGD